MGVPLPMKPSILALTLIWAAAAPGQRPEVTRPRQTSGDQRVQPQWQEGLRLTVGNRDADLVGADQRVLQAAVDMLANLGGGEVCIKAGTYRLRNAVHLRSGVHLRGEGEATRLIKEPSITVALEEDSDWYDQEITLADASGFRVGDGVCLRARDPVTGRQTVLKRTLVARSGARFKLDKALRENLWTIHGANCSSSFALLDGEFVEDVRIENLSLDGNRGQNAELDGNYAGGIFLQDCNRVQMRRLWVRNYPGDGISWQISHDVLVEDCVLENHRNLALHPGSGSQRPIIRRNVLRGSDIGLFFCWGVKYGLAQDNQIEGNRVGISIGHRDTDNLVTGNAVAASKAQGLLFRPERGASFAGHRNRIIGNRFLNNAGHGNAVVEVQGGTQDILIANNEFAEQRRGVRTQAVKIGPEAKAIALEGNRSTGAVQLPEP